jgi:hypothetical protein
MTKARKKLNFREEPSGNPSGNLAKDPFHGISAKNLYHGFTMI